VLSDERIEKLAAEATIKGGKNAAEGAAKIIREALLESDFALYWSMRNDDLIGKNLEIEQQYEAFVASRLK
jgi:hypothetical protein